MATKNLDYLIEYNNNHLTINDSILKVCKEFGYDIDEKQAAKLLDRFIPSYSYYYHSKKTPPYFKNTHLLQEVAQVKKKTGRYCQFPFKSRKYKEFFEEEKRKCREGITINEGTEFELSITGYHYYFLNYCQLNIVKKIDNKIIRERDFPKFWELHYNFFWAFQEALDNGEDLSVLKPRGTGFSEIISSIISNNYTFIREQVNFIYAAEEGYLFGDKIMDKIETRLAFLNTETDRGFRHLRTVNTKFHKISGKLTANRDRIGFRSEIIAKVIDDPDKARGPRSIFIAFEEAGSFKHLLKAYNVTEASVIQGGYRFGIRVCFGTGGDMGDGLEGLESMVYNPKAYLQKVFINQWDRDKIGLECGFFFPVYAAMDKYMDDDGNADELRAYLDHMRQRQNKGLKTSAAAAHAAEFPFSPSEALQKNTSTYFPVAQLKEQKYRLIDSNEIKRWKYGRFEYTSDGNVAFIQDDIVPYDEYPVLEHHDLKGAVSILEQPLRDEGGSIYENLYIIGIDPFSKDDAESSPSIGSIRVYKRESPLVKSNRYTKNIVAKYDGRPKITDFWKMAFMFAEYYNTQIQSEILGGGAIGIEKARQYNKLHLLAREVNVISTKVKNITPGKYFIRNNLDSNNAAMEYILEWITEEVWIDDKYTLRLYLINDLGLINEMIKFADGKNVDRIAAMRVVKWQEKNMHNIEVQSFNKQAKLFETSKWFTD